MEVLVESLPPPNNIAHSDLLRWQAFCSLTTCDASDLQSLLVSAAELLRRGWAAAACVISYEIPDARPIAITLGELTPSVRQALTTAERQSRLQPYNLLQTVLPDTSCLTAPLVVGTTWRGALQLVLPMPQLALAELPVLCAMLCNALARQLFVAQTQRESERQFRATFEQAGMGIAHIALDGRWLRVNQRLCAILGYTADELLQTSILEITCPEDLDKDRDQARRLMLGEIQQYQIEKRCIRRDGSLLWTKLTVSLMCDEANEPHYFIAVVDDIGDRKRTEAENARLAEELRIERDRLLRREVEVRTQIGRDLHDGPVQQVAVAGMMVQHVRRVAQRAPEQLNEAFDELADQLQRTTQDLRTVLYELRPLGIAEEGLVVVLRQYLGRMRQRRGLRIHLDAPATLRRLPPDYEAAIFIIMQEALNNARKHAAATDIWLKLRDEGDRLCAEVRDNGRGFDVQQTQATYIQRGSFGLLNMHERAQLIGGMCQIESRPLSGTSVRVYVPLAAHLSTAVLSTER